MQWLNLNRVTLNNREKDNLGSWEVGEESDHSGTPVLLYSLGKNNLEVASFV